MRKRSFILVVLLLAPQAYAHIGPKVVKRIEFTVSDSQAPRLGIDNLGLFIPKEDGFQWLCDEALIPFPGLNDIRFLATTKTYLGPVVPDCTAAMKMGAHSKKLRANLRNMWWGILTISGGTALARTQTLGRKNDIYRTEDSAKRGHRLALISKVAFVQCCKAKAIRCGFTPSTLKVLL